MNHKSRTGRTIRLYRHNPTSKRIAGWNVTSDHRRLFTENGERNPGRLSVHNKIGASTATFNKSKESTANPDHHRTTRTPRTKDETLRMARRGYLGGQKQTSEITDSITAGVASHDSDERYSDRRSPWHTRSGKKERRPKAR